MQLTQEAGAAGLLSVALFAAGLVFSVRTRKLSVAAAFIGSILAVGQIGQGLGQRAVLAALPGVDKADAVMILAAAVSYTHLEVDEEDFARGDGQARGRAGGLYDAAVRQQRRVRRRGVARRAVEPQTR